MCSYFLPVYVLESNKKYFEFEFEFEVWDEITYPLPNFNGASPWMDQ